MFYFELYDSEKLNGFKHSQKVKIVDRAVKLYRNENPLNMPSRLLTLLIWCGFPSLALFLIFNLELAIGWFALSCFVLNVKLANDESTDIEPFLNQVLE